MFQALPDPACAPPLGLALAFHDGSVHIVHRLSLQTMAIFYSSTAPRSMDEPAIKRPRTTGPAVHFKAMQLSWTSLALVGIDNHGKVSMAPGAPELTPSVCVWEHPPSPSQLPWGKWALSGRCLVSACHLCFWLSAESWFISSLQVCGPCLSVIPQASPCVGGSPSLQSCICVWRAPHGSHLLVCIHRGA